MSCQCCGVLKKKRSSLAACREAHPRQPAAGSLSSATIVWVDVAWNAYQTIRIAATLAEEMTQAVQDLQTLRSLDVPELVPLQDEAIQRKFRELSEQLKE